MVKQYYGLTISLKKRKEERKIIMVISDGAPVDDSTLYLLMQAQLFRATFKKSCAIGLKKILI